MEKDVLQHRPHFVTAEFGNDATMEPDRHVDLEEYAANFGKIKSKLHDACQGKLIILTFTPMVDDWHQFGKLEEVVKAGGVDACQQLYRETTRRLAREQGLPLIDTDLALRKEMALKGPGECILPDGVHLTIRGNEVVAEAVFAGMAPFIAKFLTI